MPVLLSWLGKIQMMKEGWPLDINCDLGESYGNYRIGQDESIFPWISSCNIACGFHGGDPYHIEKTIELALEHKVRIGAHPGYPDILGFGRVPMQIPLPRLSSYIKYQVSALKGMVESVGAHLQYVKPHGALYNSMVKRKDEAESVIAAIHEIDPNVAIMGLAQSHVESIALEFNMTFIAEAFIDRVYTMDGTLRSRNLPEAIITDPKQAAEQVYQFIQNHRVRSYGGEWLPMKASSYCIHGDNPRAVDILEAIHRRLNL